MPLWEQVKGNLIEWYTIAADKTEELAKIGVRRYDKFGISRDIERQFTELGSLVFNAVREGREEFAGDATVLAIVERIKVLEDDLKHKEEEIEEIRTTHQQKAAATAEKAPGANELYQRPELEKGKSQSAILLASQEDGSMKSKADDAPAAATMENISPPSSDKDTEGSADKE